jgi:hypothetical protein
MKTINSTTNARNIEGLSEQEEKAVALMLHLGNDFFELDGILYEGTEEDAREQYVRDIENMEEPAPMFEDWAAENLNVIDADALIDENHKVLTDDEADRENEEAIQNYIEECILPEIPERYGSYFDSEAFKKDAEMDGRGHNIAHYDGHEHEETVNGTTYYIYRIN